MAVIRGEIIISYHYFRHYVTSRKVAVLIPDEVIGFSIDLILAAALWP
jgi:hypothetical protein